MNKPTNKEIRDYVTANFTCELVGSVLYPSILTMDEVSDRLYDRKGWGLTPSEIRKAMAEAHEVVHLDGGFGVESASAWNGFGKTMEIARGIKARYDQAAESAFELFESGELQAFLA